MRMSSGVGTIVKLLLERPYHYDWVQVGGIKHTEEGQMFDLSKDVNELGIDK